MSSEEGIDSVPFEVPGSPVLEGESAGQGVDVVLCHGLSATRRHVVHGSKALPRRGYRLHLYDARGHGKSEPSKDGYSYERLADDLGRVVRLCGGGGPLVVGGHSMGSHTATAFALRNPATVSALILIGPVYLPERAAEADLARWDDRADALEVGGPVAFGLAAAKGVEDRHYREITERLARDRAELHRDQSAVAEALREVPRSRPFSAMNDLASLTMPTLVVGTRDEADPGHPLEVAERYAEAIPDATLVTENPGEPPLSWRGGKLSGAIASFLDDHLIDKPTS